MGQVALDGGWIPVGIDVSSWVVGRSVMDGVTAGDCYQLKTRSASLDWRILVNQGCGDLRGLARAPPKARAEKLGKAENRGAQLL